MPNPNWNSINTRFFRWTRSLEKIICSYYLPNLTGPLIYITSDYSGSHQSSKYQVLSVLYVDIKSSFEWEIDRRKVRRTYLADGRRMSFKGLNDNKKQRALIPFLDAANKIRGLSVTLVINKTIQNLCLNKGDLGSVLKAFELESKWDHKSLENAMRVTYLISILIGGLSKPNQEIFWISDEDELFANTKKTGDLQKIIGKFSALNVKHELKTLGLGTTKIDEGDRIEEDLAAIPDLIAGAISEISTKLSNRMGGKIPSGLALPYDGKFSTKTDIISSWIWNQKQYNLQKVVMMFEKYEPSGIATFRFDMKND